MSSFEQEKEMLSCIERACWEKGDRSTRLKYFIKARNADESRYEPYCWLGEHFLQEEDFSQAAEYFTQALAKLPTDASGEKKGELEKAVAFSYSKLLEKTASEKTQEEYSQLENDTYARLFGIFPNSPFLNAWRGRTSYLSGVKEKEGGKAEKDFISAATYFKKALQPSPEEDKLFIDIVPYWPNLLTAFALASHRGKKPQDIIDYYPQAIQALESENPPNSILHQPEAMPFYCLYLLALAYQRDKEKLVTEASKEGCFQAVRDCQAPQAKDNFERILADDFNQAKRHLQGQLRKITPLSTRIKSRFGWGK